MFNTQQSGPDGKMPLPDGAKPSTEFVERRGVTPLVFESVERRREHLEKAGVDVLRETARVQEEMAQLDSLRNQLRGVPSQMESARAEARAAARLEWEEELREQISMEREAVVQSCLQFGLERERYFGEVEGEVVRLALGIAERVLHREARMDPLLLAASVRLALEKLAGESGTVLRVPMGTASAWRELFGESPDRTVAVVGDEHLVGLECAIETRVGKIELGMAVQLEEIEKGFFDLLQKRPA
ncbi:FliH/SctL family protein [Granulicella sibirica]|uniref:Flagellar assembly protein FliH n=1 Tax=Granulicella sibirica TaxID=2479048 RepID=A0A4Q0T4V0_9BACT|nr:FliH/SctL family protein [Granulicella sibirica]RXH56616.1 Flagellar assembly protein FliH [Granulicella sibirica]